MNMNFLINLSLLSTYQKIEELMFFMFIFLVILYICIIIEFFRKK